MYVYAYFQKRFRLLRSVLGIQKCLALLCWKHTAFCCQPIINHSCPNSPIVSACPMAHFWARMVSIPGILSCLFSHTFLLQTPFFLPSPHSPTLIFNHSSHRLNFLWLSLEKKVPGWKRRFPPNTSVVMSSKMRLLNEAACPCPHTVVFIQGFTELSQLCMASSSVQLAECNWKVWWRWIIVRLMSTLEAMALGYRTAYPLLRLFSLSQTQSPITLMAHQCFQIPLPSLGVTCVPPTQPILSLHPPRLLLQGIKWDVR